MPDVTFKIEGLGGPEDAERLERALRRVGSVEAVNVDAERGLAAVSYGGGPDDLRAVEAAISEAGHGFEPSPGARRAEEG